jgi:hypothetical protein
MTQTVLIAETASRNTDADSSVLTPSSTEICPLRIQFVVWKKPVDTLFVYRPCCVESPDCCIVTGHVPQLSVENLVRTHSRSSASRMKSMFSSNP